jgi:hypothetical protein
MPENGNTKEDILRRLYGNAAALLGVREIEELDPLVKLFMQGFASLIHDTHNEIKDMNLRLLESLANSLTPDVYINPFPAHAVAQAFPSEPVVFLSRKNVFHDRKVSPELKEKGIKFLSFAPVKAVRLTSGKIRYLICERNFYRMEENGDKRLSGQSLAPGEKTNGTVWMALDLHPEVETLKGLSFYIDFPHSTDKYGKYGVLPYGKWSVGGEPLEMDAGLPDLRDEDGETSGNPLFPRHDPSNLMDKSIAEIYDIQFLTVAGDVRPHTLRRETFPEELGGLFPEHVTAQTEGTWLWVKAVFPVHISVRDIHDMTVRINTFPIAQKTLYSLTRRTEEGLSDIIPLGTRYEGEYFTGMESVSDSSGAVYRELPYTTRQQRQAGTYGIRRGGIERFDARSAGEHLERTINLLRDETAAFSSFDRDSLRQTVDRVREGLRQLEIRYGDNPVSEFSVPDYLILDGNREEKSEILFAEYWATHCELANGLRPGKMLTAAGSVPLVRDSCRLASSTRGGKAPANVSGRMDAYRYVLTSRDRIVTREDIGNFFRFELGNKITAVEVRRGIAVSVKPKEGLIRTVDIHLMPSPGYESILTEMQGDLMVMLRNKTPDSYSFRIIIENNK